MGGGGVGGDPLCRWSKHSMLCCLVENTEPASFHRPHWAVFVSQNLEARDTAHLVECLLGMNKALEFTEVFDSVSSTVNQV